jgi:hypothetical protein
LRLFKRGEDQSAIARQAELVRRTAAGWMKHNFNPLIEAKPIMGGSRSASRRRRGER